MDGNKIAIAVAHSETKTALSAWSKLWSHEMCLPHFPTLPGAVTYSMDGLGAVMDHDLMGGDVGLLG